MRSLLRRGFDGLFRDRRDKSLRPVLLRNVLYCDISRCSTVNPRRFRRAPFLTCFGRRGRGSLRLVDYREFSLRQFP